MLTKEDKADILTYDCYAENNNVKMLTV